MPYNKATTLGDLRNIGLEQARGELVIQWDDDDWHHPQRMEIQARHWRPGAAVLLRRQYRYSLVGGHVILHEAPAGIHGTILHERAIAARYPSLRKEEDTLFLKSFPERVVVDAPASLYIRLYHGQNTWDEAHVMGRSPAMAKFTRPVTAPAELTFLQNTIRRDYAELFKSA